MKIRNKIFIIFNLFYVYKETKHKIFYYEKLNCVRKEAKQQKTTPLYLLSERNTLPVVLAVHLHLHLQQ